MSHKQSRTHPYIQKINLDNSKRIRRKPQKLCYNCKETIDCVKLVSNKVNKIEEIVNNFKNIKKKPEKLSKFNAKFTLNNVPCELEYDLSSFTLENLQKLVAITTQFYNPNSPSNNSPSSNSPSSNSPSSDDFSESSN
ncbi:uncharacterized protein OCT59_002976 [Rhizophagus irregularis]|uniref:Uncharacterized protein n=2 Tax=Rhizophagus irregularis TaxID=588596 RepID=U9UQU8_RHIID|nr:hypothetical protein GLOIN_2v1782088 [Rhizophagus irregularis DAOM 181602=DAOM 197198]EXX66959.1 hypothetical protein RirG_118770 [Rhizophagus irregularis DAOM 197198w]UZO11407.1 hypothetical protein OCT59_002976 [Rhizophagus irregularis]POG65134.1 hypothetical protein GLOIN_2v1782088 [Rhizophagus irregularis DAOM 181602=DAOM 197198]CAB4390477.1 unnamed protein product [Rhizophagus irregularis]CAB5370668.1 unnamed protein product [Rhizophagus irregularis]|eukprot:XP_025172000.1 hypothetical protein GLOIN_2v1782088 [Rhizophagus irregularis DAOM 181602=DAOM 197198]